MKNEPFVSVIIANFNGEKYLVSCLKSVLNSTYEDFEVIIVDDGSTDRSKKIINKFLKLDKRIKKLMNLVNSGISITRNTGIRVAKGELLIFLDNDTEIKANCIQEFVRAYLRDEADAWQAKVMEYTNRKKIQLAGLKLIPFTGWSLPIDINSYKEGLPIIGLGAALAVKRNTALKIQGFDEKMIHYTDDIDFSWRAWIAGFKVITYPKAIVYHWNKTVKMRANTNTTYEHFYYNMCKNSIRSIIKNFQFVNIFKFLFWTLIINIGGALVISIKREDMSFLIGVIKGILWNMIYLVDTLQKRKVVQSSRKYSDETILSLIGAKDSPIEIYKKYL